MESANGKLVCFANSKNLELIGLLFEPESISNAPIIIHIHGNYGNFYNNKFLWYMSKSYTENGFAFLSFNLSAHDGLSEGYRKGALDYIGGGVSDYNESLLDINAAINFVQQRGYKRIILQGHSLGCDKILDYVLNYDSNEYKIILLSPVDSYAVQKRWLQLHKNETISEQIQRLKCLPDSNNTFLDWLNIEEYGAEGLNADWIYKIPITKQAFLSILEGSAFKYLNLEHNVEFTVDNPTFVFLGQHDGLQMSSQKDMRAFLSRHLTNGYYEESLDSDHDIIGVEQELIKIIISWLQKECM